MGHPAVDPREFLDGLRDRYRELQWEPLPPDTARHYEEHEQTRSRAALAYLHEHWALPDRFDPESGAGGPRGAVLGLFGRLTYRVLGPRLREERELLAHMVRVCAALEGRCDELTQRIQQLNQDVTDRQVAEARNLADLSVWLHRQPWADAARRGGESVAEGGPGPTA